MAKEGSTISGFADAFAQAVSYSLQYGVPLQVLVNKFSHVRFEPAGLTKNPDVRVAKSIVDYVFRWLATKFLSPEAQFHAGVNVSGEVAAETGEQLTFGEAIPTDAPAPRARQNGAPIVSYGIDNDEDAPPCSTCGATSGCRQNSRQGNGAATGTPERKRLRRADSGTDGPRLIGGLNGSGTTAVTRQPGTLLVARKQ